MNQLDPEIYTIAWLAPLEIEARAALHMLDHQHQGRFPMSRGDDYVFQAGDVCGHNVIIATLPAGQEYGNSSAAALASQVKKFFPNLWFGLLVGVAAGLPNLSRQPPYDIRLGDVLVGLPDGESAGLIAYGLGEAGEDGFKPLRLGHALATTETVVRSAIGSIKLRDMNGAMSLKPYYNQIRDKQHPCGTFTDPGQENDALYEINNGGKERSIRRKQRPSSTRTQVWYGPIGSGEKLIKNTENRNELRDKYNIIGLEMEAAGTINRINVGVIRGVCNYGDRHENKQWQPYAAAMAAAFAKAILAEISPKNAARVPELHLGNPVAIVVDRKRKRPLDEQSLSRPKGKFKNRQSGSKNNQKLDDPIQTGSASITNKRMLLESLGFQQMDSRRDTIQRAHPETCQWLLETSEYIDWLDPNKLREHCGFFWIKGKPGAGKSTLMKFNINHAHAQENTKGAIISFFFNARGEDLENSTVGMYRSLLLQLFTSLPHLQNALGSPQLAMQDGEAPQWTIILLKDIFEQAMRSLGHSPLFCFIDALDECDELQIRDMIEFFENMCTLAISQNSLFHVCVSSRHYPNISISKGLSLDLGEQEGHDQDIVNYVDSKLKVGQGRLAEEIRTNLIEKASGVFMWVVLVVRILKLEYDHGGTPRTLMKRLRDIPGDLHELFRDILTRDRFRKDKLLLCIQWVLFARQPLSPEELYLAILSDDDQDDASYWDLTEIEENHIRRFIISSSKGLAEVTQSSNSPTVQFIHESVRDFLLKDNGLREIWSDHSGNFEGESHERLKKCCLTYMRTGVNKLSSDYKLDQVDLMEDWHIYIEIEAATRKFPFLEYALRNVFYHADAAAGDGINQINFLHHFRVLDWIKLDRIVEEHMVRRHTFKASLLYLLAEYGAVNLINCHPEKLSCFRVEEERYGPPILAALATGSHEAVCAFLRACADNSLPLSPLPSLYEEYCEKGSVRAAVGRSFKFSRKKGLLSQLAEAGEEVLLSFALASGLYNSEINVKNKLGWTPLHYGVKGGHDAVIRLLIDYDANIEMATSARETPVSLAVDEGHSATLQLLLSLGAVTESTVEEDFTPLQTATMNGNEDIVRLLLDQSADTEATGRFGKTPLLEAVISGSTAIAAMLLDRGANIEATDSLESTPLVYATENNRASIVQLLLDRGANIEARGPYHRTPICHAAANGREGIVRLLLRNGAKIDVADEDGNTPLSFSAGNLGHSTVRLLLDNGACMEATNKERRTSLSLAAEAGKKAVVLLLLEKGANMETADLNGRTPLAWAAARGKEAIVKMLLNQGANVDAVDNTGKTPLLLGAECNDCRHVLIKALLDNNADIEAADKQGRTALWWAVARPKTWHDGESSDKLDEMVHGTAMAKARDVVHLLLARGASINYAPGEQLDIHKFKWLHK